MTNPPPTPTAPADAGTPPDPMRDVLSEDELAVVMKSRELAADAKLLGVAMGTLALGYVTVLNSIIDSLATRLASTERERWTPVSERMPGKDERVLIALAARPGVVIEAIWNGSEWDHDNWNRSSPPEHATHWMPLPAPPTNATPAAPTQPGGVAAIWGKVPAGESDAEFLRQVTDTNATRAAPGELCEPTLDVPISLVPDCMKRIFHENEKRAAPG